MKNILVIFKKELKRFFTDRRMLLSMFIPGLAIYLVYTLMGNIFKNQTFSTATKNVTYQVAYTDNYNSDKSNKPKLLSYLDGYFSTENKGNSVVATPINKDEVTTYVDKLKKNELHLVISFTDNFENNLFVENSKDAEMVVTKFIHVNRKTIPVGVCATIFNFTRRSGTRT